MGPWLSGVLVAAPFTLVRETPRPRAQAQHRAPGLCLPGTASGISQENHLFYSLGEGLRTKQSG